MQSGSRQAAELEREEGQGFSDHAHYQGPLPQGQEHLVSQATPPSCHGDGTCRPRQDNATGLAAEDERGREGGWRDYPAHWSLLG